MHKASFTPERIKVVFFDVNETLLDPTSSFKQAFRSVWEDFSGRLARDGDTADWQDIWTTFQAEQKALRPPGNRRDFWSEQVKRNPAALAAALKKHGFRLGDTALEGFFGKVAEAQERSPILFPGTAKALSALSQTYRLGIISNGIQTKQTARLRAAGQIPPLREENMFFSGALGCRKPDPLIFRHALERMGVRPNQAVMVGNSWTKDVLGAVHVHMNAVWFRSGRKQKHFRRKVGNMRIDVVENMEELLALFEL